MANQYTQRLKPTSEEAQAVSVTESPAALSVITSTVSHAIQASTATAQKQMSKKKRPAVDSAVPCGSKEAKSGARGLAEMSTEPLRESKRSNRVIKPTAKYSALQEI